MNRRVESAMCLGTQLTNTHQNRYRYRNRWEITIEMHDKLDTPDCPFLAHARLDSRTSRYSNARRRAESFVVTLFSEFVRKAG